ncbi:hypothetical protein Bxe_A0451 [Paraburkholderia xenovorans LB400]|uniref:Uncharacterized protein n=1 Tax=Paraburkholderia xenovorans (strain LB400) TaxID=266265 RepID=Q13TV7_PARXL|nr:hypothetical protein Bxe_A0451 [Paraburkholderia xenovorans LB400]
MRDALDAVCRIREAFACGVADKCSGAGQDTGSGRWLDDRVRVFTESVIVTRSDRLTAAAEGERRLPSKAGARSRLPSSRESKRLRGANTALAAAGHP